MGGTARSAGSSTQYDVIASAHPIASEPLGFGDGGQDSPTGLKNLFRIFLEQLAGGSDGNFATRAIEQFGADLFLERPYLGGDGRLSAEALLCRAREGAVARDLEERF